MIWFLSAAVIVTANAGVRAIDSKKIKALNVRKGVILPSGMLAAWEKFLSLFFGDVELHGKFIHSVPLGMHFAVTSNLQQRQHQCLIIRYWHFYEIGRAHV